MTLAYYTKIKGALFPIPAGKKAPTGIVASFKQDANTDPAQWDAWRAAHPGCNFGVYAAGSRLIIVDIDAKDDREGAWAIWCALCAEWGIPVAMPHVASPSGGWHCYFAVPAEIDPLSLRQPDAIKGRINVRVIGYTVAAGSHFEGLPYTLISDAAPYPAPAALLEHCTPKKIERKVVANSEWNREEVLSILRHLREQDNPLISDGHGERWASLLAIRNTGVIDPEEARVLLQYDQHEPNGTSFEKIWEREDSESTDTRKMASLKDAAIKSGWSWHVPAPVMFANVPALVAAVPAANAPIVSMMGGEEEFTRIGAAMLAEFMSATEGCAYQPNNLDYPRLPEAAAGRGLYEPMQAALRRLFVMAERPKPKFDIDRANRVLGVLQQLHGDAFNQVLSRLETMEPSHKVSRRKIGHVSQNIEEQVQRGATGFDKWERDPKSQVIEKDNPDNVRFGLEYLGVELRWNAWLERMQVRGGNESECSWKDWTVLDDTAVVKLLTRWRRTKTRFCPGKDFVWETLLSLAHENSQDPVLDTLAQLEAGWDGTPRLDTWLSKYCHCPDDAYHRAVSRLIIGGMVQRARRPGCKFDFMPIFYGPQGTGKSSLAAMLALRVDWFTDNILLGDQSKELVLALAGKLVVEISEMGTRNAAGVNHVKAMISRQVDIGRAAYARSVTERPRRNIFIGTTNEDNPLTDPTGNRRFLPIRVDTHIDLAGFFGDVGQLIGEACHIKDVTMPKEVWAAAAEVQEAARETGTVEDICGEWFEREGSFYIVASELQNAFRMAGLGANVRPAVHMKRFGWRRAQAGANRQRVWIKHRNNDVAECFRLIPAQAQTNGPVEMRVRPHSEAVPVAGLPAPMVPVRPAVH